MADFPALPLFTDSWIADTNHLSFAERGLYMDLLVKMWRTPGCSVPNDDEWLSKQLRLEITQIKSTLRPLVLELCHYRDPDESHNKKYKHLILPDFILCQTHASGICQGDASRIYQKRLYREWCYLADQSDKQSKKAKSRWNKEKGLYRNDATGITPAYAPTPTPTPIEDSLRAQSASNVDLKAELFGGCLKWLSSLNGGDPNKYRSVMGKWIRDFGEERVLQAFNRARKSDKPAGDPVAWMTKIINPPRKAPQI